MIQQMGGKGVAQTMRRHYLSNPGGLGVMLNVLPETLPRHGRPASGHENGGTDAFAQYLRTTTLQILRHASGGHFPHGHQTFLATLAKDHHQTGAEIHLAHLQIHQLRHPQTAGVHQLQHGCIAQSQRACTIGGQQQCLYFCFTEDMG